MAINRCYGNCWLVVEADIWVNQSQEVWGKMFLALISLAVAIILFEGSSNLDFREINVYQKLSYVCAMGGSCLDIRNTSYIIY